MPPNQIAARMADPGVEAALAGDERARHLNKPTVFKE